MFSTWPVFEQVRRPVRRFIRISKSTSMSTAQSSFRPSSASTALRLSACARLRGNPSRMKPRLRVGLREALFDHAEHDLVGHELAGIHRGLGLEPSGVLSATARRSRSPVETCGSCVVLLQALCLSAFAGTRRAEHDDSHVVLHEESGRYAKRRPPTFVKPRAALVFSTRHARELREDA